jgi:hypothetical protein
MGELISFSLTFSDDVSPTSLLAGFLRAGFNSFFRPKIGKIKVDEEVLEFGSCSVEQIYRTDAFLEGEQVMMPGVTSLVQHSDATQKILDFLGQLSAPTVFGTEFVGDCRLYYVEDTSIVESWFFRCGNSFWWYHIVNFRIGKPFRKALVSVIVPCPWFFLQDWWPTDVPCYSTSETAVLNWNRLVDFVQLMVDTTGGDRVEEVGLEFEGPRVYQERKRLIECAQRLPKLRIYP